MDIRYIRDWAAGSSVNGACVWLEIEAIRNGENVALNKPVTASFQVYGTDTYPVDGSFDMNSYLWIMTYDAPQYVEIDLGETYNDLEKIQVWHYPDGRIFRNTKTQVSADGVNWTTLFDSDYAGTYSETMDGNTIILAGQEGSIDLSRDQQSYIRIPHHDSLNITDHLTMEFWIKLKPLPNDFQAIIDKGNIGTTQFYVIHEGRNGNNQIKYRFGNGHERTLNRPNTIVGEWTHMSFTFDGANMAYYENGDQIISENFPGFKFSPNNMDLMIGRMSTGGAYLDAWIDEVRIWDVARSPDEIKNNMTGVDFDSPGLVGYWRFDEGSGSIAYDKSANNNHGYLMDGAIYSLDSPLIISDPGTEKAITLDLFQEIMRSDSISMDLDQTITTSDVIRFDLVQEITSIGELSIGFSQTITSIGSISFDFSQVITGIGEISIGLFQVIGEIREISIDLSQAIGSPGEISIGFAQVIVGDRKISLELMQIFGGAQAMSLKLRAEIYREDRTDFLYLEQKQFIDSFISLQLNQDIRLGVFGASSLLFVQDIYSRDGSILDLELQSGARGERDLDLVLDLTTTGEIILPFDIRLIDFSITPEIIGEIRLTGESDLYINLTGDVTTYEEMRGGINMTKTGQDFTMFSGDSKVLIVTVDEPTNLADVALKWGLRKNKNSRESLLIKTRSDGISIEGETISVKLKPEDTQDLSGDYYHEMELSDLFGNVSTLFVGKAKIELSGV